MLVLTFFLGKIFDRISVLSQGVRYLEKFYKFLRQPSITKIENFPWLWFWGKKCSVNENFENMKHLTYVEKSVAFVAQTQKSESGLFITSV